MVSTINLFKPINELDRVTRHSEQEPNKVPITGRRLGRVDRLMHEERLFSQEIDEVLSGKPSVQPKLKLHRINIVEWSSIAWKTVNQRKSEQEQKDALAVWQRVDSVHAALLQESKIFSREINEALAGDPSAQLKLGLSYIKSKEFLKAIIWINRAANRGNLDAIYHLAIMYAEGLGTSKNVDEAKRLKANLYAKGNATALFTYGLKYIFRNQNSYDDEKALMFFKISAELGSNDAQSFIDNLKKAEGRDREALYALSQWFKDERSGETYSKKFQFLVKEAADLDHIGAQRDYGELLLLKNRVDAAIPYLFRAAKQGDAEEKYRAGRLMTKCRDGDPLNLDIANFQDGLDLLSQAAKLDHPEACYVYYKLLLWMQGVNNQFIHSISNHNPRSPDELFHFLERAGELGSENAQYELAQHFSSENNLTEAFRCFLKLAKQPIPSDISKKAQFIVGEYYHHGKGVKKNDDEAFKWFVQADAKNRIADCYLFGEGVDKNEKEAFRIYQENGNHLKLAWCYSNGLGIEKNLEQAFHHFSQHVQFQKLDPNPKELPSVFLTLCMLNIAWNQIPGASEIELTNITDPSMKENHHQAVHDEPHLQHISYKPDFFDDAYSTDDNPPAWVGWAEVKNRYTINLNNYASCIAIKLSSQPKSLLLQQDLWKKFPHFFELITLQTKDEEKMVPKGRLCKLSEKFSAQLNRDYSEGHTKSILFDSGEANDNIHVFLVFLETGLVNLTTSNVIPLFDLAQQHLIPELSDKCIDFLSKTLEPNSFYSCLQHAIDMQNGDILMACCIYFLEHDIIREPLKESPLYEWFQALSSYRINRWILAISDTIPKGSIPELIKIPDRVTQLLNLALNKAPIEADAARLTVSNILTLFDFAQQHFSPELSAKCVDFLSEELEPDSFYSCLQHAIDTQNGDLLGACCIYFLALGPGNISEPSKESPLYEWFHALSSCERAEMQIFFHEGTFAVSIPKSVKINDRINQLLNLALNKVSLRERPLQQYSDEDWEDRYDDYKNPSDDNDGPYLYNGHWYRNLDDEIERSWFDRDHSD